MKKKKVFLRGLPLRNESGFALVMVMVTVLILELICFFLTQTRGIQTAMAFNRTRKLKSLYLAEAGLAHGLWRLQDDPDWRTQMTDLALGDGSYTVSLIADDPNRKILINSQAAVHEARSSARRTVYWLTIQPPYTSDTKEADTYIEEGNPGIVFDSSEELLLDSRSVAEKMRRTLVRFNFSKRSIPPDARIVSSFFSMYLSTAPPGGFIPDIYRLHRITQEWVPSKTTWNERNRDMQLAWSTPGGAFDPDTEDSRTFTSLGWQRWQLTGLTRFWIRYPAQNYGFILETSIRNNNNNDYRFHSSSYSTDPTLRPKFTVYYLDSRRP